MATPTSSTAFFYAVLIAPGFISVMTAISLSAIEDDISQFVMLVWSLVTSLVVDVAFLSVYQWWYGPITAFDGITSILFEPYFRADFIAVIFLFSVVLGVLGAAFILIDVSGIVRRQLQRPFPVTYNPTQPWENFMRETHSLHIKTSDDQIFAGDLTEWSRAERAKEVRMANPHRYNKDEHEFEPVGREDMLFMEDDIDRVVMHSEDARF